MLSYVTEAKWVDRAERRAVTFALTGESYLQLRSW